MFELTRMQALGVPFLVLFINKCLLGFHPHVLCPDAQGSWFIAISAVPNGHFGLAVQQLLLYNGAGLFVAP